MTHDTASNEPRSDDPSRDDPQVIVHELVAFLELDLPPYPESPERTRLAS